MDAGIYLREDPEGKRVTYQGGNGRQIAHQVPILPNTLFTNLHIFSQTCVIFYMLVNKESYQIFTNICKLNLAYFTSIVHKICAK
jgi:hypothetical protein